MVYVITSDFHAPGCAESIIDRVNQTYSSSSTQWLINGDMSTCAQSGVMVDAIRVAQKKGNGNPSLEKKLVGEAVKNAIETKYEGALAEVLYHSYGTADNIAAIEKAFKDGKINHMTDIGGNSTSALEKLLNKATGGDTASGKQFIYGSDAIQQVSTVQVSYEGQSAVVMVPYSTDKNAWKNYESTIREIAKECKRRRINTILYMSHERLGAKRKAKMRKVLDNGIVILLKENPQAKMMSLGGHTHEQEGPRTYTVTTDSGSYSVTVYSTGMGNGKLYAQVYDPATGTMKEVSVNLSDKAHRKLEAKVRKEAKKRSAEKKAEKAKSKQTAKSGGNKK